MQVTDLKLGTITLKTENIDQRLSSFQDYP